MRRILAMVVLGGILLFSACKAEPQGMPPEEEISAEVSVAATEPEPQHSELPEITETDPVKLIMNTMSLREKVSQLFIVSLGPQTATNFTAPTVEVTNFLDSGEPGGYVLFTSNITTMEGTRALIEAVNSHSKTAPFIGIDEEGGNVSRLASAKLPGYENQPRASALGENSDVDAVYEAGLAIGETLVGLGLNLDFAPVADVLTEPNNKAIAGRSYGDDPVLVAEMAAAFQRGLVEQGLLTAAKHFPGHGGAKEDSHDKLALLPVDQTHLEEVEYPPFVRLMEEGCAMVMAGHIAVPEVDESGLPASLSHHFLTEELRLRLGYEGLIITDAMSMKAITKSYSAGKAAIMALRAGADIILLPEDFQEAVDAIVEAVFKGELTAQRIDESVARILKAKIDVGIIKEE